jgi:hypothetical protein
MQQHDRDEPFPINRAPRSESRARRTSPVEFEGAA